MLNLNEECRTLTLAPRTGTPVPTDGNERSCSKNQYINFNIFNKTTAITEIIDYTHLTSTHINQSPT